MIVLYGGPWTKNKTCEQNQRLNLFLKKLGNLALLGSYRHWIRRVIGMLKTCEG